MKELNFVDFLNQYFTDKETLFLARNLGAVSKEHLILKFNEDFKSLENAIYNIEDERILGFFLSKFKNIKNNKFDEYTSHHINELLGITLERYNLIKNIKEACNNPVILPEFMMEEINKDNLSRLKPDKKFPMFSLKEEYKHTTDNEDYQRKAVIVISPNQMVPYLSTDSRLVHKFLLNKIERKIYDGQKDRYGFLGQDIQIELYNLKKEVHGMLIIVPTPINSMQYRQLKYLNDEIKKENFDNLNISGFVNSTISAKVRFAFSSAINLDELLENIIVDDKFTPELEEKYYVGYPNYENNFRKTNTKTY